MIIAKLKSENVSATFTESMVNLLANFSVATIFSQNISTGVKIIHWHVKNINGNVYISMAFAKTFLVA